MNIYDILILAFLAIGICIGLYRGFFKELVDTVGLFVAALVANWLCPYAKPYLITTITDDLVCSVVVWVVIFLLLLFVMNRLAWLLGKLMKSLCIGWLNRIGGGLFAFIKYSLIAALVVAVLEFSAAHVEGLKFVEPMKESQLIPYLHRLVGVVMPWVTDHILPALHLT
ncbi:MAG: CvpA family protein [Bacteroidales bacterium]|jgi:membrane protein required for colicin V production|nr:CvpA family protein [Bacteroidales bacterium]